MNAREFDQFKSYVTLLVAELHKAIFSDAIFDDMRAVLRLAEEMECAVMNLELDQKARLSNIYSLKRIA